LPYDPLRITILLSRFLLHRFDAVLRFTCIIVSHMCASQDNPSLPWKLVVGGPVVGANERFRLTKDGMLYSGAMGGFFQCSSSNVEMVKGYPFSYSSYSNKITFQPVSTEMALRARELVDLSTQVNAIQTSYLTAHKTAFAKEQTELENLKEANMSKGDIMTLRSKKHLLTDLCAFWQVLARLLQYFVWPWRFQ
jgi:hypothetical protein